MSMFITSIRFFGGCWKGRTRAPPPSSRMPVILPKQWLPREFSNKTFGATPTRLAP